MCKLSELVFLNHFQLSLFTEAKNNIENTTENVPPPEVEDCRRMSQRLECRRLCRLLDESLHPFSDLASDSLTEEIENDLLIALSQVFRQVKQWTHQFDSDEDLLAEPVDDRGCSVATTAQSDNRHCLATIMGELMFLLSVKSRYGQHLIGNTLVVISEFLLASGSGWDDFMNLLCAGLEFAICNSLGSSSEPGALETRYLDCDSTTSISFLKQKLKNANWFVVASIFRVLRNIQKSQKHEFDDKLMIEYLDSVSSLVLNLPWDMLRERYFGHKTGALEDSAKDVLQQTEAVQQREMIVFFGNLIQFLSTLVSYSSVLEDGVDFSPVICRIFNLVTKLTAWCHAEFESPDHVRISHYFRHKVLMLMIKLSSSTHIEQTGYMTWIHLIHKYFEDLLMQPISGAKLDQDDFLEGSPFCTSISDPGEQTMLHRHLQRLTVFLFLKCSLNIACIKGKPDELQFTDENLKYYSSANLNLDSESCIKSIGSIELHQWLQTHVNADILANDEPYFVQCVRFSLSFLQLFMHEDDILFEILLQLFRVPFYPERLIIKDEPLGEVKNHLAFLASDLFNPVQMFHLFLSEIHYDHQVLLDYLISKDTGSSCTEYLLRSLRIVCNSWSLFVEFPRLEQGSGQLCPKRQKVVMECTDRKGVVSSSASLNVGRFSSVEEHNEGHAHGRNCSREYRLSFMAARDCLVSLRTSIDSLNRKKLFPYTPQVLLRRLMKFEELCTKQ